MQYFSSLNEPAKANTGPHAVSLFSEPLYSQNCRIAQDKRPNAKRLKN
jgi:hypothetical protein